MNTDDTLTRTLKPLREPLPPEHSLLPGILERLDQPMNLGQSYKSRLSSSRRTLLGRRLLGRWRLGRWLPVSLAMALVAILAFGLLGPFQGASPLTMAEVMAAIDNEHWVHLVYQHGSETWVCLDDGKVLMKQVNESQPTTYFLRDSATRTEQRLFGGLHEIHLTHPEVWVLGNNRNGKIIPLEVDELTFSDKDLSQARKTSEKERSQLPAVRDYDIVVEGDQRLGHFSDFTRDALGELRATRELWVDLETKLPVRIRSWEFAGNTAKRVYREGTFHFVKNGPADLYDLGVPRTVPIVPQIQNAESAKDRIPTDTWKAIHGARQAVRRFPHRFRVLTLGNLSIVYVDSGDASPFDWVGDDAAGSTVTRYFFADCQDPGAGSPMFASMISKLDVDLDAPIPADDLAKSFPLKLSVNTTLIDGRRWFVLTRSATDPPRSRLQVLTASQSHGVRELQNQWQYARWNLTELATGQSTETAPAGQILVHAERSDLKHDWFVDPQRDYTVARHLEYRRSGEKWMKIETRAIKWQRLPDGPWYVSAWETHRKFMVTRTNPDGTQIQQEEDSVDSVRLVITPLTANDFPADIFDGDKFLEAAKSEGAEIRAE